MEPKGLEGNNDEIAGRNADAAESLFRTAASYIEKSLSRYEYVGFRICGGKVADNQPGLTPETSEKAEMPVRIETAGFQIAIAQIISPAAAERRIGCGQRKGFAIPGEQAFLLGKKAGTCMNIFFKSCY